MTRCPGAGAVAFAVCTLTVVPAPARAAAERAQLTSAGVQTRAPTVESQDRALASALLRVTVHPAPETQNAVGAEYSRIGLLEQAYSYYTAAIRLNPREAEAYEMRARIWRDWGFPQRGMGDAARAVYYAPRSASAHNTWGTVLAASGRTNEARLEFERARALNPDAPYVLSNLCYMDFLSGEFDKAIAKCQQALAIDRASAAARNNLALSLAADGRYAAAEEQFRAAGGAAIGYYNAGVAFLAARRFPEARAAFEAVATAHPLATRARARAAQARTLTEGNVPVAARNGGER
jgi:tetratricopeptide (TPR) repeat protein